MFFCRNNIDNVAKFFEEKYSDHENIDYMIYNLCSEMDYDHRKFHGHVRRYKVDDHNVPSLEQMFELTDDVREWLSGWGFWLQLYHHTNVILIKQQREEEGGVPALQGGQGQDRHHDLRRPDRHGAVQ